MSSNKRLEREEMTEEIKSTGELRYKTPKEGCVWKDNHDSIFYSITTFNIF